MKFHDGRYEATLSATPEYISRTLGDRYRIERPLGEGGMAVVYLAEDLRQNRAVALKVLRPELAVMVGRDRFLREIAIVGKLSHPHIVPLFDAGEAEGLPYYVMPYIEGETLRGRLRREKELPIEDALQITREVAEALTYAHALGVIHRDIKPENIMLSRGHALLADFGIGRAVSAGGEDRLTGTGVTVGTVDYMSPEQALGSHDVDERSDQYSLACVLYEMLVGAPPFVAPTAQAVIAKQLADPVPPIRTVRNTVPASLEAAILFALAKSPADRFATVTAFVAGLDRKGDVVVPPAPRPDLDLEQARSKGRRRVHLLWTALAALGIAATTYVVRSRLTGSTDNSSIAVLPIENVGSDSANQYSAAGMSEELSGALNVVRGLRVVPPASAAYFLKGKAPDYRALGEALKVKAILTGTSFRLANHLRITMVLINVSDRTIMWTDTLSRELQTADDLFAVRDAIVAAIVEKLRIRLEPIAVARAKARPTENLDAATAYMQGRYLLAATRGPANMAKAMTFFQRAIALDSLYAAAYSGLADVYAVYGTGNMADYSPNEFLPLARQTAQKALSLDPSLAEAHVSLGWARMLYDFDWSGAEAEFNRGIQLDSAYSLAYAHRASFYHMVGQFDRARADGQTAARLDPVNMQSRLMEGRGYFFTKQYEQATVALQRAVELNATDHLIRMLLGQAFEQRKMFDSALFELRTAVSLNPRSSRPHALLVHALASSGDTATAIDELHLLEERLKVGYVPALDFAIAYVGLGDLPRTFAWLNRACDDHSIRPYLMDPGFDSIRSDPRYRLLMKRLHLPA